MKKIIYILSVLVLSALSANKSFAYNYYTDNGATYSNEQFQRDVKSYLDAQMERQENQDLINNLYSSYGNAKSQFEIQQLQQEVEKAKEKGAELDNQIKQVQEIINQQNQILSQQKSNQSEDTEMIDYCNSLKRDLPEGVLEGVAKLCAKHGVTLKVEALFDTQKVVEKTPTKKVERPAFLDEQTETKMPNILDEKPATTSSTTTMHTESVVQKSFLRKTFEKIKSFFVWW